MTLLHPLDLAVMTAYFLVLLWIGFLVMRSKQGESESEPFLAAAASLT